MLEDRYLAPVEEPLLDLRLPDVLPAATGTQALVVTLLGLGVDDDTARRAAAVVGELIVEARKRETYDASTSAIHLSVRRAGDRLRVSVNDRRAPDVVGIAAERLSWKLARLGFVENLQSRSDERGNATECDVVIGMSVGPSATPADEVVLVTDEVAEHVQVRAATPADAEGITQLAFRTVGFTHIDTQLYSVEALRSRLDSGGLISFVAVGPDGEIVGHIALVDEEDDIVPEWGRLMVDARWRGRKLSTQLGIASLQGAHERELPFLWSECTARHPIAQKGSIAAGGIEVGLLIGAVPDTVTLAGFERTTPGRGSLVPFAIPVKRGPARTVSLPEHHWPMYREVVERLGIERDLTDPVTFTLDGVSDIHVGVHAGFSVGRIAVRRMGSDVTQRVADEYLAMAASGLAVVYIDIGLDDPAAAEAIRVAEANGFFWAALLPEARADGDVLRMQRIGWVGVDAESCVYASEFGEQMGAYVRSEWARVMAPAQSR